MTIQNGKFVALKMFCKINFLFFYLKLFMVVCPVCTKILPQKSNKHQFYQLGIQPPVINFSSRSSHFLVISLVEELNKEPEGSIVPIAVEETRGHLGAALPLSGDSHFYIILILLKI